MTPRCEWNPDKHRPARNGDRHNAPAEVAVQRDGGQVYFVCRDCHERRFSGQKHPPAIPRRQHRYSRQEFMDAIKSALAAGFAR